jgi:hypothetical protein
MGDSSAFGSYNLQSGPYCDDQIQPKEASIRRMQDGTIAFPGQKGKKKQAAKAREREQIRLEQEEQEGANWFDRRKRDDGHNRARSRSRSRERGFGWDRKRSREWESQSDRERGRERYKPMEYLSGTSKRDYELGYDEPAPRAKRKRTPDRPRLLDRMTDGHDAIRSSKRTGHAHGFRPMFSGEYRR